jgi:hypothetical protein
MSNIIRDARGMSDLELELRDRISRGDRMVDTRLVLQVLDDITTMRRMVYEEKALDATIADRRARIDDLDAVIELKREAAL